MHHEYLNAFDRNQNSALTEDQQNKFDRHDALIKKTRTVTATQDERETRRAQQRAGWVGPNRSDVRTTSGIKVTADLKKLKEASDAERVSRKVEIPQPSEEDVLALANQFMISTPEYVPSPLNGSNLLNALVTTVAQGRMTFSVESFRKAFYWLRDHGYIEQVPESGSQELSAARRAPAKVYPAYVDPAQKEEDARIASANAALADRELAQRYRKLPFAELQKIMREGNPKYGTRQEPI